MIECYYSSCKNHTAKQNGPEEGPFCAASKCIASEEQLVLFAEKRKEELESISSKQNA